MDLINSVIEYGGKKNRSGELFGEGGVLAKSKKLISTIFSEEIEENVLLQHKPYLSTLVD